MTIGKRIALATVLLLTILFVKNIVANIMIAHHIRSPYELQVY